MSNGLLPDYVRMAKPNPPANRAPWYKNTAPTYAGIMLWFVFWHEVPLGSGLKGASAAAKFSEFAGGTLSQGIMVALGGLILAALLCHFLFYLVPGLLGMQTGLPLYIVGTSTYGAQGGFLMPGFLMGVLQFGWLSVNAFFSAWLLCAPFGKGPGTLPHAVVVIIWAAAAAFMGLKGIQYVARVATFLPVIPLAILVILALSTIGGLGGFDRNALMQAGQTVTVELTSAEIAAEAKATGVDVEHVEKTKSIAAKPPLEVFGVLALIATYVVGFFATAGAAGTDFGMNNRDKKDVQMGGLVGIAGATVLAGGLSLLIVAGAHGGAKAGGEPIVQTTALMSSIVGGRMAAVMWYLLAIAAFPPACFSSFIAANSFKTTLPKVNPFVSCGLGTFVACVLAVSGWAGNAVGVFKIIGASFGPICGAMMVDYLLSGKKWAGPRAGFNPAGWISWAVGFVVGAADFIPPLAGKVPCPPMAAFLVGAVLYFVLAKAGLQSRVLEMPAADAAKG